MSSARAETPERKRFECPVDGFQLIAQWYVALTTVPHRLHSFPYRA
jgi:hypothetical protein